jgi:hypothetical protein
MTAVAESGIVMLAGLQPEVFGHGGVSGRGRIGRDCRRDQDGALREAAPGHGLWNSNHGDDTIDPDFLDKFEELKGRSYRGQSFRRA